MHLKYLHENWQLPKVAFFVNEYWGEGKVVVETIPYLVFLFFVCNELSLYLLVLYLVFLLLCCHLLLFWMSASTVLSP